MKREFFYHFTSETLRDGSPIPPIGEWLTFKGTPKICYRGLHASRHPMDALTFAPGKFLHMVELTGIETEHRDKVVARKRRIIATIDSTDLLLRSSRHFSLDVIHLWTPPEIVVKFLQTGDPLLARAASDAAWAARAAASDTAWAARAAAWAARAAAWAARAAASDTASDAARAAAKQKQRDWFLKEVQKEFKK